MKFIAKRGELKVQYLVYIITKYKDFSDGGATSASILSLDVSKFKTNVEVFTKLIFRRMGVKMRYFCFSFVITITLLLSFVPGCARNETPKVVSKFDRQAWLDAEGESIRQKMVKSLENELKRGMTAEEVVDLMGKPDTKIDRDSEKSYIYSLGRGLIDYEEYRVIFDDAWKVKKFSQLQG